MNCGIKTPFTVILTTPVDVAQAFFVEDQEKDRETVYQWVKNSVIPVIYGNLEHLGNPLLFLKNGCFSNKFDASTCIARPIATELAIKIIEINYSALCVGAGGITEIALRELIPSNSYATPTIYNGLPLRPEFRIFYDFDNHKVLYSVNYWDYRYCHEDIERNATDRLVFQNKWPLINFLYRKYVHSAEELVTSCMNNVTGLSGNWSIDLLLDENNEFWLIDMAIAEQSAYWDPNFTK